MACESYVQANLFRSIGFNAANGFCFCASLSFLFLSFSLSSFLPSLPPPSISIIETTLLHQPICNIDIQPAEVMAQKRIKEIIIGMKVTHCESNA